MAQNTSKFIHDYIDRENKVFIDSLAQENERAIGIIAVCWLDNLLENLLRKYFIKDQRVNDIFSNEHILQTYYAKVHITYFLGLIPKHVFHDLKLLGEIRNKFAHELVAELTFDDDVIIQRINRCLLNPLTFNELPNCLHPNCLKFIAIVSMVGNLLIHCELLLEKLKPPYFVDIIGLDKKPYTRIPLSKSKLFKITEKCRKCSIEECKQINAKLREKYLSTKSQSLIHLWCHPPAGGPSHALISNTWDYCFG